MAKVAGPLTGIKHTAKVVCFMPVNCFIVKYVCHNNSILLVDITVFQAQTTLAQLHDSLKVWTLFLLRADYEQYIIRILPHYIMARICFRTYGSSGGTRVLQGR